MKQSLISIKWTNKLHFNCYDNIIIFFLLLITNILYAQQLPNPIRYYPLDKGMANEIIQAKNGTIHGTIEGSTDRFGNPTGAADFIKNRSTSPFIETPAFFTSKDIPNKRFAITFWALTPLDSEMTKNFFFTATGSVATRQRLFNLGLSSNGATKENGGIQIGRYIAPNISNNVLGKTVNKEFSYWLWPPMNSQYCANLWTFFAISLTPQSTRVFMKALGKETAWATNYFPSQDLSTASFWGIGDFISSSALKRYSADYMDDFKVYADSLDINQIQRLYDIEKPHGGTMGVYRLKNVKSGLYLTANYGVSATLDTEAMIKSENNAGSTYLWKIDFPTTGNFDYIQWLQKYEGAEQKCLNIYRASTSDNAVVGTWGGWDPNAKWKFERQSDGTYIIKNQATNTYLATENGSISENSYVRARTTAQSDGSGNWVIEEVSMNPIPDGYYRLKNKNSDLYFAFGTMQTSIQGYQAWFRLCQRKESDCGGSNIWRFESVDNSYKLHSIIRGRSFWFGTTQYNLEGDVLEGFQLDGNPTPPIGDNGQYAQDYWVVWKDVTGNIRISNRYYGKVLAVKDGSKQTSVEIDASFSGSQNAQWIVDSVDMKPIKSYDIYYNIKSEAKIPENLIRTTDWDNNNLFAGLNPSAPYSQWRFVSGGNFYRIYQNTKHFGTPRVWDLYRYNYEDSSPIGTYDQKTSTETNQQWFIYKDSKNKFRIVSAYTLKYARLVTDDNAKFWLRNCCNVDNLEDAWSQWTFEQVNTSGSTINNCTEKLAFEIKSPISQNNKFSVTPNPFHNFITVSFFHESDDMIIFNLIDLNGQNIYSKKQFFLRGQQTTSLELKIANTNIVYILRVVKSNGELIGSQKILRK